MDERKAQGTRHKAATRGARYVGEGDYWPGVPARDLSAEEWLALEDETRAAVLRAGLYEEITSEEQ